MNKAQQFIIEKLNDLYNSIEGIKIRYEYRDYLSTHIIEILPLNTFEFNDEYILFEMRIEDEFESIFGSDDDILFISSDSLNEIKDVQYSWGYISFEKIAIRKIKPHSFNFEPTFNNVVVDNTSYALAA